MSIFKQLHPKKKIKTEKAEANDLALSVMIKHCSFAIKCVPTGINTIIEFTGQCITNFNEEMKTFVGQASFSSS